MPPTDHNPVPPNRSLTSPEQQKPSRGEEWPIKCQAFLKALYVCKGAESESDKVVCIKEAYKLSNDTITGCGNELRLLEFYILTKLGIL